MVKPSHANVENVVDPPRSPRATGVITETGRPPSARVRKHREHERAAHVDREIGPRELRLADVELDRVARCDADRPCQPHPDVPHGSSQVALRLT
jgi:hypothetical protein